MVKTALRIVGVAVLLLGLAFGLLPYSVRNGVQCGGALTGSVATDSGALQGMSTGICKADKGDTRLLVSVALMLSGGALFALGQFKPE